MATFKLSTFVSGWSSRDREMVDRWRVVAEQFKLDISVDVHDLTEQPRLASQFNIVCIPTTIIECPDGRTLRCIGYGFDLEALLRAHGWSSMSSEVRESALTLIEGANRICEESARMIDRARRKARRVSGFPV